jgi:hypothetical protein
MAVAIDYVDRVLREQCDKRVPGDLHGARRQRDGGEQHARWQSPAKQLVDQCLQFISAHDLLSTINRHA